MNDIKEKLKLPAIGLLVAGILNALVGGWFVLSVIVQAAMGALNRPFVSDAEKMGFYAGFFGSGILGLISLIVAPIIIFGAIKMMKGEKYGLAKTASILAIIPFTSCCFLLGIPMGIWSFVTLKNSDVKAFFNGDFTPKNPNPPSPPNF